MPRPTQPLISSELAVRTALEMIDADGLDAFSIEGLGRRLNVRGQSIYHHFNNKADLLANVARRMFQEIPMLISGRNQSPWDEQLMWIAGEFRRVLLQHPRALPLLLTYSPRYVVPEAYEYALRALADAGVPTRYRHQLIYGLDKLVLGAILTHTTDADPARELGAFDSPAHPHLAEAISAELADPDQMFAGACRAYIDGVRQLADG